MRFVCPLLLCAVVAVTADARAEQRDPFDVDLHVTLPTIVGSFLIAGGMDFIVKPTMPGPHCGTACDPASLNVLDRGVASNRSDAARAGSNVFLLSSLLVPALTGLGDGLLHRDERGLANYAEDLLIMGETQAVNYLLNDLVKFSIRRPRPFTYDTSGAVSDASKLSPDSALSFYSLHASATFSAATSYTYLFAQRHPGEARWSIPVGLVTHALAATTAILRAKAGKHFWTDVLVGAAVGSCVGLLVPYLHRGGGDEGATAKTGAVPLGSLSFTF